MSELYNVYSHPCPAYEDLKKVALEVAKQFPRLSASGFFEEVRSNFYPRPDDCDMRALLLRLVTEGELRYTHDWKVELA